MGGFIDLISNGFWLVGQSPKDIPSKGHGGYFQENEETNNHADTGKELDLHHGLCPLS